MSTRGRPSRADLVLADADLEHDQALLAIARELAGANAGPVLARLDDASRPLFGIAGLDPQEQAARLATALTDDLALRPATACADTLLIDRALETRSAHPVVLAAIGQELARRAGLVSRICTTRTSWWIALYGDDGVALVGCAAHPAPSERGEITVRCPHHVAFAVLDLLRRHGPLGWHASVERLIDALPLESC